MQSDVIARSSEDFPEAPVLPGPQVQALRRRTLPLPVWIAILISNPLSLIGCVLFAAIFFMALLAPVITPYAPDSMLGPLGQAPSFSHWLGTNDQGQDIFSQIAYGARFSLAVGLGTGFAIATLATLVGMIAGYAQGWVDDVLTLVMNVFLIIPQLPLLVVISAYVPLHGSNALTSVSVMVAVITITGWAWGARVIRSQTMSLRGRDFVQASLVAGEATWRIVFVEMLPNMISLIVNTVIMSTMGAILTEAALDYLGIGNSNQITWGTMLYRAQSGSTLFTGEWWAFVFPGLAIALTTMSMILINNGVDAISNPRLRIKTSRRRRTASRAVALPDAEATA